MPFQQVFRNSTSCCQNRRRVAMQCNNASRFNISHQAKIFQALQRAAPWICRYGQADRSTGSLVNRAHPHHSWAPLPTIPTWSGVQPYTSGQIWPSESSPLSPPPSRGTEWPPPQILASRTKNFPCMAPMPASSPIQRTEFFRPCFGWPSYQ
jgi:hypothetical protein